MQAPPSARPPSRAPRALAILLALVAALVAAPGAQGARDPLGSGSATVVLSRGFMSQLRAGGIELRPIAPLQLRGRGATFPVGGGEMDPTRGRGTVGLDGGLRLRAAGRVARISSLVLDTADGELVGNVAGRKLVLASLGGWSFRRDGFGVDMRFRQLRLAGGAARLLKARLRPARTGALRPGRRIGAGHAEAQPRRLTLLPGGTGTLRLAALAAEKLAANEVQVEPLAPAVAAPESPPTYALPLAGGAVGISGGPTTLEGEGQLRLEQQLEVGPRRTLYMAGFSLELAGARVEADPWTRSVLVEGAAAVLAPATANSLNGTFVAPLEELGRPSAQRFAAGERIGSFSFRAEAQ